MRRDLPERIAWVLVVVVFALGTAGLVTAMAHDPGSSSRSELTWRADRAIEPQLDAATAELGRLATDFEALGAEGRVAMAALTTGDAPRLEEAMDAGQALVDRITETAAGLRSRLRTLPGFGPVQDRYFSSDTIERWNKINAALDTTDGIGAVWLALTTGGTDAVRLMTLLQAHDEATASAAKVGSEGDYEEAVRQLDIAAPILVDLRRLQAQLAARIDVTLLDELLDRTARLDDALRALYTLLVLAGGESTPQVEEALRDVEAARDELPEDTRALSVILTEIGRAGPTDAVIRIEQARGRLLDAIGALGEPEASPTDGEGEGEGEGEDDGEGHEEDQPSAAPEASEPESPAAT